MERPGVVRAAAVFAFAAACLATAPLRAQPERPAGPPCTPAADVVCGQQAPEDLMALGPNWVVASAESGTGGIRFIRVRDRMSYTAYPSDTAADRPDERAYPDCPGPPAADDFPTHGIYAEPGAGPRHRLFVVRHGEREAVEIFEVDTSPELPAVTWLGCVVAPEPIGLNSVRGLPDGGFIATNFLVRDRNEAATQRLLRGEPSGELWEWHRPSGWVEVPGSDTSGPNGVELAADGKTLYIAAWGSRSLVRLSRGSGRPERDEVPLGFRVDNIHWSREGRLYAAGQAEESWKLVEVDPDTLAVREILTRPDTEAFGGATAVAEVGEDLWVGSYRGNRIAVVRPE